MEDDGSNLASLWLSILGEGAEEFLHLQEEIKSVFPLRKIKAPIRQSETLASVVEEDGREFDIDETSDGIRQLLILITKVVTWPPGSIFVVEEPEVHLHPAAQRRLFEFFLRHSDRHQFVLSTHAASFARPLENVALFLCTRSDAGVKLTRVNPSTDLPVMKAELGYLNSDAFGADVMLFVEGDSEEEAFPILAPWRGIDLVGHGIRIQNIKGKGKMRRIKEYLRYLRTVDTKPFIILDGDERIRSDLEDWGREGLIPSGCAFMWASEFEDLFPLEKVLLLLQGLGYPSLDQQEVLALANGRSIVHGINEKLRRLGLSDFNKTDLAEKIATEIVEGRLEMPTSLDEALVALGRVVGLPLSRRS
jgi:hypothetical protein